MSDKKSDLFGDKVKALEALSAKEVLDENSPICIRIDGKAFHTFTKGLARPYDKRLSQAMINTMNFLVEKTDARLGYTQSDEISLVYFKMTNSQQTYFGSRVQKLISVLSSMATAKFNDEIRKGIPEKEDVFAYFDCRAWNVPTLQDAADVFVWRQDDAIKNAVSMAASAYYSHKQLQNKSSLEKKKMLEEKNISWEQYPDFFKSGTFAMKKHKEVELSEEMKQFESNADTDNCLRSYIHNFSLERLRKMEDYKSVLFDPIFNEYKMVVDRKKKRKRTVSI